jgi:uncharacterized membrane protein
MASWVETHPLANGNGTTPTTITAYLTELKTRLKGQPAALIQDALADCEEHLRAARADAGDKSEADVLTEIIETYGTPHEVAEEYVAMEQAIKGPFASTTAVDDDRAVDRGPGFFGVLVDPNAYGALIYMLLSLATGIFYFTWAVTGVALSAGFAILIIGVPFALLFIGSVRVIGWIEGRIVEALLGVRMPRRAPTSPGGGTIWENIKAVLKDGRTWTSLIYMILHLPLGILYFCIAVISGAVSLGVMSSAAYEIATGNNAVQVQGYPELDALFNSVPGLALLVVAGFLGIILTLHIARVIGYIHGRIAEALLVRA